jgi:hypothetical protein
MRHNDWKEYHRAQRQRQLAQLDSTPNLYAPQAMKISLKSDDAIEAEIEAAEKAEQRMVARMNSAISEIFAQAAAERRAA